VSAASSFLLRVSGFGVWWFACAEQAARHRATIQRTNDMDNGTWNPEGEAESIYPQGLQKIVSLFESLPEQEKRDALISYADQARKWEPKEGETFNLEDIRKDEECTDTVGVFLKVDNEERATFRVTLGPQVQTLTRAMTSILCRGLEHSTVSEILKVPSDFVPKIVGGELIRVRSQTVYYVLTRMKGICKVYFDRRRSAMSR
jgi:cysteine desulfuration protein SufE